MKKLSIHLFLTILVMAGISNYAMAQGSPNTVTGVMRTGEPGKTETVGQIMDRELKSRPNRRKTPKFMREHEVDREHLKQNRDSPNISQWPPERSGPKAVNPPTQL